MTQPRSRTLLPFNMVAWMAEFGNARSRTVCNRRASPVTKISIENVWPVLSVTVIVVTPCSIPWTRSTCWLRAFTSMTFGSKPSTRVTHSLNSMFLAPRSMTSSFIVGDTTRTASPT